MKRQYSRIITRTLGLQVSKLMPRNGIKMCNGKIEGKVPFDFLTSQFLLHGIESKDEYITEIHIEGKISMEEEIQKVQEIINKAEKLITEVNVGCNNDIWELIYRHPKHIANIIAFTVLLTLIIIYIIVR